MRFDLGDLRVFLSVAQLGSFKRAAADCSVTLPAVSLRMKKLEEAFAAPLFERRSRGVALTAAGLKLRDEALKVMQAASDLEIRMAPYAASARDTVRLHASMCPVNHLPRYMGPFLKAHPDIHFEFVTEHTDAVIEAVASGRADLGAVSFPIDYFGVQYLPMNEDAWVLASPAGSGATLPEGCARSVTQRDIAKMTKIYALGPNVLMQSHIERLFEKAGLRLPIATRLPTLAAALHVAGVTGGWVITFLKGLKDYAETIRIVPIDEPWARLFTQFVIPSDETRLSKNAAEFVRFYRENAAALRGAL